MDSDAIVAELYSEAARNDPNPWYAKLHELGPVQVTDPKASVYTAIVNGFDMAGEVLRDPRYNKVLGSGDRHVHPVLDALNRSMMFSAEPDHGRMRRLFNKIFTPRRVAEMESDLLAVVDGLLDGMAERGADGTPVDFVAEFGFQFPIKVIGRLLDLPESDLVWFRERAQRIDEWLDVGGKNPEKLRSANEAVLELTDYYLRLFARRRARPGTDLVSGLVRLIDSGDDRLTDDELVANMIVLLNASFVTTMNLLGNGLPPLLARPDLVRRVRTDAGFASRAVEEILRYDSPVQLLSRIAAADVEFAGIPVPAGGVVLVLIGAANRDPRRHVDPDTFDPARPDVSHHSFGGGGYFCLGAALARLEGRLAFPRLFQRFPELAIAAEPVRNGSLQLRGYSAIPVTTGRPQGGGGAA